MSPIPFLAPTLFPYDPDGAAPVRDTWSYPTLVQRSYNGTEWRQAQRRRPLLRTSWQMIAIDPGEASQLTAQLYADSANWWAVPLWSSRRTITNVVGNQYSFDDTNGLFYLVTDVLILRHGAFVDAMTLAAMAPGVATLNGVPTVPHQPGDWIVPLGKGQLDDNSTVTHIENVATFSPTFVVDTVGSTPLALLPPGQIVDGFEVLPFPPVLSDGVVTETFDRNQLSIGSPRGLQWTENTWASAIPSRELSWILDSLPQIESFRRWLQARRGRKAAFWAPTYQSDFHLAAPAAAGDGTLEIVAAGFASTYAGNGARKRLAVLHAPDTVEVVTIVNVEEAGDREILHLQALLENPVTMHDRLSFLTLVRLADDDAALDYDYIDLARITLNVVELPREVP